MPKYRVKQGKKFGPGGRYPAGSIIEMSEREAKPFSDILEAAADSALVGSTQAVVPHEDLQFENELETEIPDELKMFPGTVGNAADIVDEDEDVSASELIADEDEPKSKQKKTSGKSTRKRATEE